MEQQIKQLNSASELWNFMDKNISYGFIDGKGEVHFGSVPKQEDSYRVHTPKETLENKVGLCIDQVEVEKLFFKEKNIPFKEYIIGSMKNGKLFFHFFLIFESEENFYWFEHAYDGYNGIKKFNTLQDAFSSMKNAFLIKENITLNDSNELIIADVTSFVKPDFSEKELNLLLKNIINIAPNYNL